ncbi:MAG TPA: hypothetical protein VF422_01075 [Dokdonella sp.]
MKPSWIAALLVAFLALPALAKDKVEPAVNASDKDAFATVSSWVRGQMREGGRYEHVTPSERTRVNERLDEMTGLFEQAPAVDRMSDEQKLRMFNSQEEVNAILAKRDNERLVCKNVKPIGSHIPVRQCMTAGELEARRRADDQYLRRTQQTPQHKSDRT